MSAAGPMCRLILSATPAAFQNGSPARICSLWKCSCAHQMFRYLNSKDGCRSLRCSCLRPLIWSG